VTVFGSPSLEKPGGSQGGVAVPVDETSSRILTPRLLRDKSACSVVRRCGTFGGDFTSSLLDVSTMQQLASARLSARNAPSLLQPVLESK
jgi:hypothetical protein